MKKMMKVELVIESVYIKKLLKLFKKHKISGYTLIKDIEGSGGHGLRTTDDLTDVGSNNYIFTLCEEEHYEKMDKDIRSFLDMYGGKCMLSDVKLLLGKVKK